MVAGRFVVGLALATGCGPAIDDEATSDTPAQCNAPTEGVAQARIVDGRIEVLTDGHAPDPLTCGEEVDGCDYELHRLEPNNGIDVGTYVDGESSWHETEYCSCCNGEDDGSENAHGTVIEQGGQLVIEAVNDACVVGSFELEGTQQRFVATWCG